MEAACDADGRLLGIRGHMRHDHGANTPYGVALPYNAATNMIGPYVLPVMRSRRSRSASPISRRPRRRAAPAVRKARS